MPETRVQTLYGLQVLRGLAALAVLIHHVMEESRLRLMVSDPLTRLGAVGVDVFFVLSGFLMLYTNVQHFAEGGAASSFLRRRIIRVVPLYWLTTFVVVVAHVSGLFYKNQVMTLWTVIRSLLFIENSHPVIYVAWTLNYEMYFYLVFSLCLLVVKSSRFALPFVGTVIILDIAIASLLPATAATRFLANPNALEFLMGMALALAYGKLRPSATIARACAATALVWMYLSSALTSATETGGLPYRTRFLTWGLPAALAVFSFLSLNKPMSTIGSLFLLLGDSSYSLYLTHSVVMTIYAWALKRELWMGAPAWLLMIGVVTTCVFVSVLVHRYIEKPIHAQFSRKPWVTPTIQIDAHQATAVKAAS